jgi:hypothetical protein
MFRQLVPEFITESCVHTGGITASGSPHILASMFRWDDSVSRIPESEESAWLAL